jgi:hypothetical protein
LVKQNQPDKPDGPDRPGLPQRIGIDRNGNTTLSDEYEGGKKRTAIDLLAP